MEGKITALIVDDEKDCREVLAQLIESHFPQLQVLGTAADVEDAYAQIIAYRPQLVFLDIQMPRANGFNLLRMFDTVPFEVVFVTSYDQYAINAIRFNALDYILKPVAIPDLRETISRASAKIARNADQSLQIVNLLYTLTDGQKDKKIAVHSGQHVKILTTAEILYIEGDGRYCKIETIDNASFTTAKVIKDFEDYLGLDSPFIRVNKSVLLNPIHIREYSKKEPFYVEMVNGRIFDIPRRKKSGILERLGIG